jgi:hypothetical protein
MLRQAWIESRHNPCVVAASGSYGLYQWIGSRRRKLLATTGGQCPTWEQQLAFADNELRSEPSYAAFWQAAPDQAFHILREKFGYGR